jgi:UPF0755 protein
MINKSKFFSTLFIICLTISLLFIVSISNIKVSRDSIFLIKSNSSVRDISKELAREKLINNQVAFFLFARLYCKFHNKPIIAGEYQLRSGLDPIEIMKILTGGKVVQHKITVVEGFTVKQVIERLEKLNNIEHFPEKLNNIEEGSIMPDTYFYTYGTLDIALIKVMQGAMANFIANEWPKRDKRIDKFISSPQEAIILASIVEKETYIESEKPLIAGLYINRLKNKMRLQSCPTVIYGLKLTEDPNWDKKLRYSHLKSQSEYNTYLNSGLPPKPICNPGTRAILAVLHPQWTEKLFFVSSGQGKHYFASDFKGHIANIRKINSN